MNIDPIFTSRPEQWPVVHDAHLPLSLLPETSSEKRMVKTGCSFRACDIYVEVPTFWHEDRVNMYVSRFRQAMDK